MFRRLLNELRQLRAAAMEATYADDPRLTFAQDQQKALDLHNEKRRELCSKNGSCTHPDLQWSDKLAQECTAYAKQLIDRNMFEHSGAEDVGENLYMGISQGSLSTATQCWLDEEKYYHGQPIDGALTKYGHYTQCVWPGSKEVGIGMAERTGGRTVVVARYSPAGNYFGQSAWTA